MVTRAGHYIGFLISPSIAPVDVGDLFLGLGFFFLGENLGQLGLGQRIGVREGQAAVEEEQEAPEEAGLDAGVGSDAVRHLQGGVRRWPGRFRAVPGGRRSTPVHSRYLAAPLSLDRKVVTLICGLGFLGLE